MGLGSVPAGLMAKPHEMPLAKARMAYYAARAERQQHGDPLERRREAKRQRLRGLRDQALTVGVTVQAYLKAAAPRLAARTLAEYRRQFDRIIIPGIGADAPLSTVTSQRLREAVLAPMEQRGCTVGINRTTASLKAWMRWCEEHYGIQSAAGQLKIDRRVERSCDRVLTEAETVAFWKATDVPDDRIAQCLRFMLLTALRPGEAASLSWQGVESNRITIPLTKNGRAHSLPLSAQAQVILDARRPIGTEKPSGLVFNVRSDVLGQRIRDMLGRSRRDQTKRVKELQAHGGELKKRAPRKIRHMDCPAFTPHDLRRTALTMLAQRECPLQVIQKIANHAPSGVTQQVYVRYSFEQEAREWLDKLGTYIDSLATGKVASLEEARAKKGVAA